MRRVKVNGLIKDEQVIPASRVKIDGLSYESLSSDVKVEDRIKLLDGLRPYTPQPYQQLASFYSADGYDAEAKKVLYASREASRRIKRWPSWNWLRQSWHMFLRLTVGYGYYPARAGMWLFGLWLVGTFLFGHLWREHITVAVLYYGDSVTAAADSESAVAYPAFNPWFYTLDLLLPIVDLQQARVWLPHGVAEFFSVMWTILGWTLITALVVGLGSVFKGEMPENRRR